MSVVINVHDDLARRLEAEAASQRVSVEVLATTILDSAVPPLKVVQDGGQRNRRRLELIRKSTRSELTNREQAELDQLQTWLDEQFESFDTGLLNQLNAMKQTVLRLSTEPSPE
jgi:predicted transcriptional regulator